MIQSGGERRRTQVVVATGNRHKVEEIRGILGDVPVTWVDLSGFPGAPEVAETGATFEENARIKALAYARHVHGLTLADDSGLEVDALGGRPGVHSARFAGPEQDSERNIDRLLAELATTPDAARTARFVCTVAISDGARVLAEARGACEGTILRARRGRGGFGYDPVFLVPELGVTFAELSAEEKNRRSHRGRALAALRPLLLSLCG